MELGALVDALVKTPVGRHLSPEEARAVAAAGSVRDAAAGEVLLKEGEPGSSLVILLEGEAEVTKALLEKPLATVPAGTILGEVGLLTDVARTATVRATKPSRLFTLDRASYLGLAARREPAAFKMALPIAQTIAERVAAMHRHVVELLEKTAPRQPEFAAFRDTLAREWNF